MLLDVVLYRSLPQLRPITGGWLGLIEAKLEELRLEQPRTKEVALLTEAVRLGNLELV